MTTAVDQSQPQDMEVEHDTALLTATGGASPAETETQTDAPAEQTQQANDPALFPEIPVTEEEIDSAQKVLAKLIEVANNTPDSNGISFAQHFMGSDRFKALRKDIGRISLWNERLPNKKHIDKEAKKREEKLRKHARN